MAPTLLSSTLCHRGNYRARYRICRKRIETQGAFVVQKTNPERESEVDWLFEVWTDNDWRDNEMESARR